VKGAAEALTGNENIWKKPSEAVRAAGNEVLTNRDLREKPVEAAKRGAQEVLTNEKMHRGVMAGGEMDGRVSEEVIPELGQQVLYNSVPAEAAFVGQFFPRLEKWVNGAGLTASGVSTSKNLLTAGRGYEGKMKELATDLRKIAEKYGF